MDTILAFVRRERATLQVKTFRGCGGDIRTPGGWPGLEAGSEDNGLRITRTERLHSSVTNLSCPVFRKSTRKAETATCR